MRRFPFLFAWPIRGLLPNRWHLLVFWLLCFAALAAPAPSIGADFEDGLKAYQAGDYQAAYRLWTDLAEDGDPAAMRNVGHLYRWGHGVTQDHQAAALWYRRAADLGLDRAQANLGMMYLEGQGVDQDPKQAAYWLSQAAIQGHTVAQYNLAQLYLDGRGVQRSEALALGWLQRAAQAGHPGALEQLATLVATAPPPEPSLQRRPDPPATGPATDAAAGPAAREQPAATADASPEATPPSAPPAQATTAPAAAPTAERDRRETTTGSSGLIAAPIRSEESGVGLEVQVESPPPAILDRLAAIFDARPEVAESAPKAAGTDALSGVAIVTARPPSRREGGTDPAQTDEPRARSAAESWVLGLIETTIGGEGEETGDRGSSGASQIRPTVPAAETQSPAGSSAAASTAASSAVADTPPDTSVRRSATDLTGPAVTTTTGQTATVAPDRLAMPSDPAAQSDDALRLYQSGRYAEARTMMEPPARAGIGVAQYMMGWMNEAGRGGARDMARAWYWYTRAAASGDRNGRRALADLSGRADPDTLARGEALLAAE